MAYPRYLAADNDPAFIEVREPSITASDESFAPTRGTVTALIDGRAAFVEMARAIEAAKKYIYLSAWYLMGETPVKGTLTIADLMSRAAARGVDVRIVVTSLLCAKIPIGETMKVIGYCDARSASSVKRNFEALNAKKKIRVVVATHPKVLRWNGKEYHPGCFHDKFMVVDGVWGFCGGLEFTEGYSNSDPTHKSSDRHDVHAFIEGSLVKHLEAHFVTRWNEQKGVPDPTLPEPTSSYDATKASMAVQLAITKYPSHRQILDALKAAVYTAKKYIYIENQYFRDAEFTKALITQLSDEPDLRVIIVLPTKPEEKEDELGKHAEYLQRIEIQRLRDAVEQRPGRVGIYSLYRADNTPIYVHAKVMIIDDTWATIGSANMNQRSFRLDGEANVVVRDDAFARKLRMDLWGEHVTITDANKANADLANAKKFVEWWETLAAQRVADRNANRPLQSRIAVHVPRPGEQLPSYLQILIDNPDLYTGDFAPQPIG